MIRRGAGVVGFRGTGWGRGRPVNRVGAFSWHARGDGPSSSDAGSSRSVRSKVPEEDGLDGVRVPEGETCGTSYIS
jgi:hypothetical protein